MPLLALDAEDEEPGGGGKKFRVVPSTVVLSRVCVNYLSSKATFADWSICAAHRAELLTCWRPAEGCCHHQCPGLPAGAEAAGRVTYAMSKTILRCEGMVLPIGGRVCRGCKEDYIQRYIPALTSIKETVKPPPAQKTEEAISSQTENKTEEISVTTEEKTDDPPPPPSKVSVVPDKAPEPATPPAPPPAPPVLSPEDIQRRLSSLTPVPIVQTTPLNLLVAGPAPPSAPPSRPPATVPATESSGTDHDDGIAVKDENDENQNNSPDTAEGESRTVEEVPETVASHSPKKSRGRSRSRRRPNPEQEQEQEHDEYKFYCKLCHIGFLKETSYKYHLANNQEQHAKIRSQKNKVRRCGECGKSFSNDNLFRRHLYNEHKVDIQQRTILGEGF